MIATVTGLLAASWLYVSGLMLSGPDIVRLGPATAPLIALVSLLSLRWPPIRECNVVQGILLVGWTLLGAGRYRAPLTSDAIVGIVLYATFLLGPPRSRRSHGAGITSFQ